MSTTAAASPPPIVAGEGGRYWWLLLVAGILTVLVGIIALLYPGPTLLVVGLLFGAYLAVWGGITLFHAVGDESMPVLVRVLEVVIGLLGLFAGLLLIVRPGQSVLTAALVLGFWWVVVGVLQVVRGVAVGEGRVWNLIWGAIAIIAGAVILAQPGIGLVTLVWIVSLGLVIQGAVEIAAAFGWRKLHKAGLA
jgi:uncharacterized membrane protein HdeD (DUF308 family)